MKPFAVRCILIALAVSVIFCSDDISLMIGDLSKGVIIVLLGSFNYPIELLGDDMLFNGQWLIPWSNHCNGVNTFTLLCLLCISWIYIKPKFTWGTWMIVASILPVSLLLNAMHVLLISSYRILLFPAIESPELHYFFGFLTLIPFFAILLKLLPAHSALVGSKSTSFLLLVYISVVLSSLTTIAQFPGGTLAVISTLLFLITRSCSKISNSKNLILYCTLWLLACAAISWSNMESLWLPALLSFPLFKRKNKFLTITLPSSSREVKLPTLLLDFWLLAGTIPLLHQYRSFQIIIITGVFLQIMLLLKKEPLASDKASTSVHWGYATLLILPFLFQPLFKQNHQPIAPRNHFNSNKVDEHIYKLNIPELNKRISVFHLSSTENGRHHSIAYCSRIRRLDVKKVEDGFYRINGKWVAEIFIQGDAIFNSYEAYLLMNPFPISHPGYRIIVEAPQEGVSKGLFIQTKNSIINHTRERMI